MNKIVPTIALGLTPIVVVFLMGRLFPVETDEPVAFQPPGYVFGIAWTLITLALGIVMSYHFYRSQTTPIAAVILFFALVSLWAAWTPVYQKYSKKVGLGLILASLAVAVAYFIVLGYQQQHLVWLVFPICGWLGFAASLNGASIQLSHK